MKGDRRWPVWGVGVCWAIFLAYSLPLVSIGIDDVRVASVFSVDEADIATQVRVLYQDLGKVPSFKYGGVFYYLPALALKGLAIFWTVDDRLLLMVLRLFCTAAGLGCIWFTYRIGYLVGGDLSGLVAAVLLTLNPTVLRWSVEIHPDLPQLFWILGAMWFCCRLGHVFQWTWVLGASLCAGLAFGTKYAGGFLIPVIWFAIWFVHTEGRLALGWSRKIWFAWVLVPTIFFLIFATTNPFALLHPGEFVETLLAEKKIMEFGHRLKVEFSGGTWFVMLVQLAGPLHCLVLAGFGSWYVWSHRGNRLLVGVDRWILMIWIGFFMLYLFWGVNLKRIRHLLPVLPCVLIFVGLAYHRILDQHRWGLVLGVAVMVGGSITHLAQASQQFVDKQNRLDQRPELTVGRWLAETFPDSTSILYDMYAYVPSRFQNTFRLIGQSYVLVNHFEPDLLVIRDATAHDYSNRAEASRARMGERSFLDRHFFYRYLAEGRISTYRLLQQFDGIAVYERTVPRIRTEGTPRERWRNLVKLYLNKQHYGVVSARWTMGYLHTIWGEERDAEQEFRLAREATNFARRVYKHGIRALETGRVDEAKNSYAAALQSARGQSVGYRAGMRENLSFQYLKAGLFAEAAAQADTALALNLPLSKAAFQKAAAEIALGGSRGKLLFKQAVAHFGTQDVGETVLRILVDQQVESSQDLLERYYSGTTP